MLELRDKKRAVTLVSALLVLAVTVLLSRPCLGEEQPHKVTYYDEPIARMQYAGCDLWNTGNRREAIRCFDKALAMNPSADGELSLVLVDRAMAYFGLKEYKKAWRDLDRAEKNEPSDRFRIYPQVWRAYILLKKGKVKSACPLLENAVRVCPDVPEFAFARGVAAQREGHFSQALEIYALALVNLDKYAPEQKDIRARILFNKSMCLKRLGKAQDATAALLEGPPHQPESKRSLLHSY